MRRNWNVQFPEIPDEKKTQWKESCSGGLEINWFYDDFLPRDLQNILTEMNSDDVEEN